MTSIKRSPWLVVGLLALSLFGAAGCGTAQPAETDSGPANTAANGPNNGAATGRVEYDNPPGVAQPLDNIWSQVATTEDMVYVAGQRGRLPDGTQAPLDDDGTKRVRQAFENMKLLAEAKGAELTSCVRLVVYVTDIKYRAVVNKVQNELWGDNPKPPRTILVVNGLNQDDIVEIDGTFARVRR